MMSIRFWGLAVAAGLLLLGSTLHAQVVQPTSFVPIIGPAPPNFMYVPGAPGFDYAEYNYGGGIIFNNNALNNYNVTTSGAPAPTMIFGPTVVPTLDFGGGGTTISNFNQAYLGGGRDNFTTRGNAFVVFTTPGNYVLHHGADDTTYTVIDTVADGTIIAQNNCCPQDQQTPFTITQPGTFALDFVFGEQGGGEWQDLGISGPGITGTVALGDVANGSPAVFQIALAAVPEPASVAIWVLMGVATAAFGYRRWRRK